MEKQCTVLIVEDDDNIRHALQMVLEYEGYLVHQAAHGKQALDLLPKIPEPCVILLDLMMPVMSGWETAEALHSHTIYSKIPVVVVTAFTEKAQGVKCDAIVKKPVDLDILLPLIHRYCVKGRYVESEPTTSV